MTLCACGCGTECKKTYCQGHNARGKLGKIGRTWTEEEKKKVSATCKERGVGNWMKGKPPSKGFIENRYTNPGFSLSEETKNKISEKNKGPRNGMYRKSHTPEARAKISEASFKMWATPGRKSHFESEAFKTRMKEARKKSKNATSSSMEDGLAALLDTLLIKYQRHKYIKIKHGYQSDFFLPELNIVVECDGIYWHHYPYLREVDKIRTREMEECGIVVLRIWEHEAVVLDSTTLLKSIQEKSSAVFRSLQPPYSYFKKMQRCESLFRSIYA